MIFLLCLFNSLIKKGDRKQNERDKDKGKVKMYDAEEIYYQRTIHVYMYNT